MRAKYPVGFAIMPLGQFGQAAADGIDGRMRDGLQRFVDCDRRLIQEFARKIETTQFGVFVEIAQNVRQLQGASEMVR